MYILKLNYVKIWVGGNMYDLELEKNEEIKILDDKAKVIANNKTLGVSIVVTNKNMYLLDIPRGFDDIILGNVINPPVTKRVIAKFSLEDVIFKENTDLGSIYMLKDNNYLEIISDTINDYLKKLNK